MTAVIMTRSCHHNLDGLIQGKQQSYSGKQCACSFCHMDQNPLHWRQNTLEGPLGLFLLPILSCP